MTDGIKNVYVVGHTAPDTDSVCSAIAYAYFKNITDKRYTFMPVRAGKLNHETDFVLSKFGVPASVEIDSLVATPPMFIAALFIIARTWKQPRCPSADEWIRKQWYIHTMEYYSAIK